MHEKNRIENEENHQLRYFSSIFVNFRQLTSSRQKVRNDEVSSMKKLTKRNPGRHCLMLSDMRLNICYECFE